MKLGKIVHVEPSEEPFFTINLDKLRDYLSWVIAPVIGVAVLWGVPVAVGAAIICLRSLCLGVIQSSFFQNALN